MGGAARARADRQSLHTNPPTSRPRGERGPRQRHGPPRYTLLTAFPNSITAMA